VAHSPRLLAQIARATATARGEQKRPTAPFAAYDSDPVGFFHDILGVDPWGRHDALPPEQSSQVDILEAVRDHDKVAVRSGHKIGKSSSASGLALWWLYTRTDARVTLTAPANHQVESILWAEVRLLHTGQHPGVRAGHTKRALPGKLHLDCRAGLVLGDGWGVWGLTTNEPERMSGKSGSKQLIVIDEASGYPEEIYTSVFGNLAGGGKVVLFSNPTRTVGTFKDVFYEKGSGWKRLWIDSRSTPNFHTVEHGGTCKRVDGLADPEWEKWAREHWGGDGSPLYDVRVCGKFPAQGECAVVPLGLVEAACARYDSTPDDGELEIGVDVSREGDDESILAAGRGLKCIELQAVTLDRAPGGVPLGNQVGEAAAMMARRLIRSTDRYVPRVKVDCVGVGSAVVDYLLTFYRDEFEVIAVNVGSSADKSLVVVPSVDGRPGMTAADVYRNLRAQLWFGVAAWLKAGGAIPADEKLHGDLVAPRYLWVERGRQAVEEKSQIKKTLKRSPDRGDALCLMVYEPPVVDGAGVGVTVIE
jgi:phage terminase large subunit